jgi:hypothetical protein
VIAVGEHSPTPTPVPDGERAVDVPGSRDLEALHPPAQRLLVVGLDEQMNMRPLNADVHDADPLAQRRGDRRVPHSLV